MLTQFKTLHDVKCGRFRHGYQVKDLLKSGDAGIGTFDDVCGEMIALDGVMYRATASGSCTSVKSTVEGVPYGVMVNTTLLAREKHELHSVKGIDILGRQLLELILHKEMPYFVRLKAYCEVALTRAPDGFSPPYPSLEEIIAQQPEVETSKSSGDVVGFYTPPHLSALGVPGFHLHFITEDRQRGGHLNDIVASRVEANLYLIESMKLFL